MSETDFKTEAPKTEVPKTEQPNSEQPKSIRVLDVGNCGPDHSQLSRMLTSQFGAQTFAAQDQSECFEWLSRQSFDLILVNRKLDCDYSDGIEIIRQLKKHRDFSKVPVMLITNYAEHQALAVAEGALPGFGKLELNSVTTRERLAAALAPPKKTSK